jgi:predicted RNase H-like nuclease
MLARYTLPTAISVSGATVAGYDGCRGGWLGLRTDGHSLETSLFASASQFADWGADEALADVPIGLTASGPRHADHEGRLFLGWPRRASIFSAPIRPMIGATSQAHATQIGRAIDGRGLSAQAFGILDKVAQVDMIISPQLQRKIRECHPEVSFATWRGSPMVASKKTSQGRADRRTLVDAFFGPGAFAFVRALYPRTYVKDDDILDTFASLWSAIRLATGAAILLPAVPQIDARGLRMEYVR